MKHPFKQPLTSWATEHPSPHKHVGHASCTAQALDHDLRHGADTCVTCFLFVSISQRRGTAMSMRLRLVLDGARYQPKCGSDALEPVAQARALIGIAEAEPDHLHNMAGVCDFFTPGRHTYQIVTWWLAFQR